MVLSTETRSYFSFWFYQGNASWPMIYFFNHVIGQTKKKVNILRNIIQELKANTWNKREARENAGDIAEICFSFHLIGWENGAVFFFKPITNCGQVATTQSRNTLAFQLENFSICNTGS